MQKYKSDFPIFNHPYRGRELVYLDSASTTQKPQMVIEAVTDFYKSSCSIVHRSVNQLGEMATNQYNDVRIRMAQFLNSKPSEIIFTSGTTAGINLVATVWGRQFLRAGDEIILSIAEHHSNLLPWQQLANRVGAQLKIVGLNSNFELDLEQYRALLNPKTKLVALTHVSNVIGVTFNLNSLITDAKQFGAAILIDAAQAVPYIPVDVRDLNCDFLVCSSHKMLGPDGVGVLFMAERWHDQLEPYQLGGGMVSMVDLQRSSFLAAPEKFEAGTPPISGVIGLGAAIQYYQTQINWVYLEKHLAQLCAHLIQGLSKYSQVRILGSKTILSERGHLVSFTVDGFHAHDIAAYLDQFGICVRAGHHCAQPLHNYFGLSATVRVSFQIYNTISDADLVVWAIGELLGKGLSG